MPVIDEETGRRRTWPYYLAGGCCGCLLLVVIGYALMAIIVIIPAARRINSAMSGATSPPKSVAAYRYSERAWATACAVPLPDGWQVTYMQVLGSGSSGKRAVEMAYQGQGKVERPLLYSSGKRVKVGFYWYPMVNHNGPYVRVVDDAGEQIVDFGSDVTRRVWRKNGHVFAGAMPDERADYDNYEETTTMGRTTKLRATFNGKPAPDMAKTFGSDNGVFIGSIVESGGKLVFVPAKGSRKQGK